MVARVNDRFLALLVRADGLVNALHCALWTGATVEMLPKFEAGAVWQRFMDPRQDLTLFMAVPTVYSRLMAQHASMSPEDQKKGTESCKQFRLMISGSAPLPSSAKRAWAEISGGQVLLERYGMSESELSCLDRSGTLGMLSALTRPTLPNIWTRTSSVHAYLVRVRSRASRRRTRRHASAWR